MAERALMTKIFYKVRNIRCGVVFKALEHYSCGDVLDVGGRDFYLTARNRDVNFSTWTTLDDQIDADAMAITDRRYRFVRGDGCNMKFADNTFDIVTNLQVLEHVLSPEKMVREIARVLKPGGHGIFLIPQTSVLHEAPCHYYNFTRYWIEEIMKNAGLKILEIEPIGGVWSSMASHMLHFFPKSFRSGGMSSAECKRNAFFYFLYPLMVLYAAVSIPICMILSLGDLSEEPNNHMVVVTKPEGR